MPLAKNPTASASSTTPSKRFDAAALRPFTGESGKPIYVALKGRVFDVTSGASF